MKDNNMVPNWRTSEIQLWTPPEELNTSQWAEKYRILSAPSSEKGPLRMSRTPYLVPFIDAFFDPDVEEVVLVKSAQIAGTEGVITVMGKKAHRGNCPMMLVMADEDTAEYMSENRIQKMFTNSHELSNMIIPKKFNKDEITLKNGSYIAMGWASSVAKLASRPMEMVIFDEIDKPGYNLSTSEASPLSLGAERTETYDNSKVGKLSTPTSEDGNIIKELKTCDVVYDWQVPCPFCGVYQPLVWGPKYTSMFEDGIYYDNEGVKRGLGGVVWEGGRNATEEQVQEASYMCGSCGKMWTTLEKNRAVEKGIVVSRTPNYTGPRRKIGFWFNRLLSLLGSSGDITKLVRSWIKCQNDPKQVQGFFNSTLAEPYKRIVVKSSESAILKAKTPLVSMVVPESAVCLTCGVDVQKYNFWFVVRAWAADMTSWLIHYGSLSTWDDVESLLFNTYYPVVNGEGEMMDKPPMRIWRAAVDTGGGDGYEEGLTMTEETELWLIDNGVGRGARVWGTKGSSKAAMAGTLSVGKPREKTPSGKPLKGGLQIISLNTGKLKDNLHYRFKLAADGEPGGAYLPSDLDHVYINHIQAEEKRIDGKGVQSWVKIGSRRNDLLDCECMAAACVASEWPGGGLNLLRRDIVKRGMDETRITSTPHAKRRRVRSEGIKI